MESNTNKFLTKLLDQIHDMIMRVVGYTYLTILMIFGLKLVNVVPHGAVVDHGEVGQHMGMGSAWYHFLMVLFMIKFLS